MPRPLQCDVQRATSSDTRNPPITLTLSCPTVNYAVRKQLWEQLLPLLEIDMFLLLLDLEPPSCEFTVRLGARYIPWLHRVNSSSLAAVQT